MGGGRRGGEMERAAGRLGERMLPRQRKMEDKQMLEEEREARDGEGNKEIKNIGKEWSSWRSFYPGTTER